MSKIQIKHVNPHDRARIPGWLSNPKLIAPCPCGRPLLPGQPYCVTEGDTGMRRWIHGACWEAERDGDEDEEEWDEE